MHYPESIRPDYYSVSSMFSHNEVNTRKVHEKDHYFSASWVNVISLSDLSSVSYFNDFSFGDYKSRTELGRKLLEIRRRFILKGGKLLSPDEIDREKELRQGGLLTSAETLP